MNVTWMMFPAPSTTVVTVPGDDGADVKCTHGSPVPEFAVDSDEFTICITSVIRALLAGKELIGPTCLLASVSVVDVPAAMVCVRKVVPEGDCQRTVYVPSENLGAAPDTKLSFMESG